jgi:hypothetical protein
MTFSISIRVYSSSPFFSIPILLPTNPSPNKIKQSSFKSASLSLSLQTQTKGQKHTPPIPGRKQTTYKKEETSPKPPLVGQKEKKKGEKKETKRTHLSREGGREAHWCY